MQSLKVVHCPVRRRPVLMERRPTDIYPLRYATHPGRRLGLRLAIVAAKYMLLVAVSPLGPWPAYRHALLRELRASPKAGIVLANGEAVHLVSAIAVAVVLVTLICRYLLHGAE